MKKFLIAGSSLAAVAAAGSAGAVDVTLGGSIDMGVEFGLGKNANNLAFSSAFNEVNLSIKAAHTTDGGLMFGGAFSLGTTASIEFDPYADAAGDKFLAKRTVDGRTNIAANLWNVSGGGAVAAAQVVSVKINSSWLGIDKGQTEYTLPLGAFGSHNICKIAGRANLATSYGGSVSLGHVSGVGMYDGTGKAWAITKTGKGVTARSSYVAISHKSGYLPAMAFHPTGTYTYATATVDDRTAKGSDGDSWVASQSTWSFGMDHGNVVVKNSAFKSDLAVTARYDDYGTTVAKYERVMPGLKVELPGGGVVEDAAVRLGPFMEVMMSSSETKMVVGAACLEGNEASKTAFFLDNAADVMTVSDASIYIEGGFGKLTLQTGSYAGGVTSIAGAGDVADINAGGLVVITQGVGLFGANPYLAVDLAKGDSLGALEVITGGIIDMGDLYAAVDVALDNPSDVFGVSAWDLGLAYDMGDLSLGFATDSSSDWGLSASMAIAGFGVKTVFGSSSSGDHTKSGITYSVRASTALNGFKLALGFDQDLEPTVGVSYDLGGLVLSAGYDAGDEGGSLGAKLSF
jgi:hypothetical protein